MIQKYIIFFFIGFYLLTETQAQVKINGNIRDTNEIEIPFANIVLYAKDDTTSVKYGTLSDLNGNFLFSNIQSGRYILSGSSVGYSKHIEPIEITDSSLQINIRLKPLTTNLKQVNVTGVGIKQEVDKTIFYITKLEKQKSTSSLNLLEKIPKLHVDNFKHKVTVTGGGKVKLLLNGSGIDEKDLRAILPDMVFKIEYYEFPPARFANSGYDAVINIVTKSSIQGGSVIIDFENAIRTKYGTNMINMNYNKNKTQFSLSYNLQYWNNNERILDESYTYTFDNIKYEKKRHGTKGTDAMAENIFDFNFINQVKDNYYFKLNFSQDITPLNRSIFQDVYSVVDTIIQESIGERYEKINIFNPLVNVYFSKKLKNKQEIIFDILGNYSPVNYEYNRSEVSRDDTILYDYTIAENRKQSLISEFVYSKTFSKIKSNSGFRYKQSRLTQTMENLFDNEDYHTNTYETYAYTEVVGKLSKLSYQISLGLSYNVFKETNLDNSFYFWSLRPILTLNYPLNKKVNVKLNYTHEPKIPTLSQLSNSKSLIEEKFVYYGNPNLKPFNTHNVTLKYNYILSKFKIFTELYYLYSKNPILSDFILSQEYIVKTYNNQLWYQELSVSSQFVFNPFQSGILQLSFYGEIYQERSKYLNLKNFSLYDYIIYPSLDINYKKFIFKFQYINIYDRLKGQYAVSSEPYSRFIISYKKNNVTAGISVLYPFSDYWIGSKRTIGTTIVSHHDEARIYDLGQMISLNFSYNFSFGRKYKHEDKIINNSDYDYGIPIIN